MDELYLDKLHPVTRALVISMMSTALQLEKQGFNKEKYMLFCSGIWESMKMSDPETLLDDMCEIMREDMHKAIKTFEEDNGYNGHCS